MHARIVHLAVSFARLPPPCRFQASTPGSPPPSAGTRGCLYVSTYYVACKSRSPQPRAGCNAFVEARTRVGTCAFEGTAWRRSCRMCLYQVRTRASDGLAAAASACGDKEKRASVDGSSRPRRPRRMNGVGTKSESWSREARVEQPSWARTLRLVSMFKRLSRAWGSRPRAEGLVPRQKSHQICRFWRGPPRFLQTMPDESRPVSLIGPQPSSNPPQRGPEEPRTPCEKASATGRLQRHQAMARKQGATGSRGLYSCSAPSRGC